MLGSIDANRGDPQNGWDTDQFPNSVEDLVLPLYEILRAGGIAPGGFNFDAKLRRQSIDRTDLFHAHIGGLDTLARALLVAADLIEDGELAERKDGRYSGWDGELGTRDPRRHAEPRGPRGARGRWLERAASRVRQPGGARERRQPGDLVGRPLTSMAFVIGIDTSTTATKAVVIDEVGRGRRDRRGRVRLRGPATALE